MEEDRPQDRPHRLERHPEDAHAQPNSVLGPGGTGCSRLHKASHSTDSLEAPLSSCGIGTSGSRQR
eukprot:318807-Pyramimonas_sp.AAC.1